MIKIPHPIPYQGSKRKLAPQIGRYIDRKYRTFYEPFAGSAAMTIYAATHELAEQFVIGDLLNPLAELWELIVNRPNYVSQKYRKIWQGQKEGDQEYFYLIRQKYNETQDPVLLLYLVARCVKNAVRFGKDGRFTQSVDKRRKGMHPDKMQNNIVSVSQLLVDRTSFFAGDFEDCIKEANPKDIVYMDPPYQGTTYGNDKRYFAQISVGRISDALKDLNERNIEFILSYDGKCGNKSYGVELPKELNLRKISLDAGRSSQSTLSKRKEFTTESLYLSPSINESKKLIKDKDFQLLLIQ